MISHDHNGKNFDNSNPSQKKFSKTLLNRPVQYSSWKPNRVEQILPPFRPSIRLLGSLISLKAEPLSNSSDIVAYILTR